MEVSSKADLYNYKLFGTPFYNADAERKNHIVLKYLDSNKIIDKED